MKWIRSTRDPGPESLHGQLRREGWVKVGERPGVGVYYFVRKWMVPTLFRWYFCHQHYFMTAWWGFQIGLLDLSECELIAWSRKRFTPKFWRTLAKRRSYNQWLQESGAESLLIESAERVRNLS